MKPHKGQFQKGHKRWDNPNSKKYWFKKGVSMPQKIRKKISKSHMGHRGYWFGKKHTEEYKIKMSQRVSGKNHWNWKGGIKQEYPKEFNKFLRYKVRERDNFTCCLCKKTEEQELKELKRILCVNHINWDRNDNRKENLNTLCLRCNIAINQNKQYYMSYFRHKI